MENLKHAPEPQQLQGCQLMKSWHWFNILLKFEKYLNLEKKRPKLGKFLFLKMTPHKILRPR